MKFRNCMDCGDYKYIEDEGKCPSCLGSNNSSSASGDLDIDDLDYGDTVKIKQHNNLEFKVTNVDYACGNVWLKEKIGKNNLVDYGWINFDDIKTIKSDQV